MVFYVFVKMTNYEVGKIIFLAIKVIGGNQIRYKWHSQYNSSTDPNHKLLKVYFFSISKRDPDMPNLIEQQD